MTVSPQPYLPRLVRHWDDEAPGRLHRRIEGSLAFVDISGFTKMPERLARQGKVGAEELTEVIGRTFGELLPAAYGFGANLVKFGGDALLLLFTDDGHDQRACAAAQAMQQTLAEVGVCFTSAGKVRLRMSVGIHSGIFDFFLIGDSHRELVVAGPAATRTVAMEAAAGAGQILVSAETAAGLPASNLGKSVEDARLLRGKVSAEAVEDEPAAEKAATDINQFVPIGLCQLLLGGEVQPEHRPATVAFIDYHGFDEVIETQGAVEAARRLDQLVRLVQSSVDARGVTFLGTDIASDGGKIILTAGVPSSTGHDEEQMLLALREIVAEGPDLPVSIGVNWGSIFAGEIGTSYRRTYTVMGDVVNLAARLMAKAPSGQIYATPDVLQGSRTTFETEPIEPFMVKGKKLPVQAVSLGPPIGARGRQEDGLPLIGRDPEMAQLTDCWGRATEGSGQMVEVVAEAGMGKSRVLAEFLHSIDVDRVMEGECRLYQAATPYFPFRSLLREAWVLGELNPVQAERALADLVSDKAPELMPWLSLIGLPLGLEIAESDEVKQLEDQFRPERTIAAVGSLLEATITRPSVFVIEDTHWMDEPSRELLDGMLPGIGRCPWMFVLTRRPGEDGFVAPESEQVTRLELQPLGFEQARDLIFSATEDDPLPLQQVERLARQANGRPLFLIELMETLRRGGSIEEVPQSVEAMIGARIDTLPHSERNVLRRLAVLGSGFLLEHTGAVLDTADTDLQTRTRAVRQLSDFLSLDQSGWVQFRHSLIRDVAYAGLPFKTRLQLHGAVGDSIYADCDGRPEEFSELLSLHYFHAKHWSRTWRFSRMAGERAREIYANHEAAAFYQRALTAARGLEWVTPEQRAEVLRKLAEALYEAGRFEEAITALREAKRLISDDPVARADLQRFVARSYQKLGKYSQGLRETAIGLKSISGHDRLEARKARARLRALRAGILSDLFRPRQTLDVGLKAVDEAAESGEQEALARAYTYIDEAYQTLGQRDMAIHEPMALEIFEELGDLSGIALIAINLGVQAYADGEWVYALEMYSRAQEVSRKSGNQHAEGAAAANLGEVLVSMGRFDEAEAVLREARRVLRAQKDVLFALFAETQLGRLAMERGALDIAISSLTKIVDDAITSGQSFIAVDTSVHLAEAHVRNGDPETAHQVITVAQQLAGEDAALYEVPLERVRAAALLRQGRLVEAAERARRMLDSAKQQGLVYEEALLKLIESEAQGEVSEEAMGILRDLGATDPYVYRFPSPML
ncbi:MAG: adenylate/guanylate cyclase domain-containing protein [Acidimicrobiia bacterium]